MPVSAWQQPICSMPLCSLRDATHGFVLWCSGFCCVESCEANVSLLCTDCHGTSDCCIWQVDDVLKEDAEKARSLEEVIAELERLQTSEREKDSELAESQALLQVWGPDCPDAVYHPGNGLLGF